MYYIIDSQGQPVSKKFNTWQAAFVYKCSINRYNLKIKKL